VIRTSEGCANQVYYFVSSETHQRLAWEVVHLRTASRTRNPPDAGTFAARGIPVAWRHVSGYVRTSGPQGPVLSDTRLRGTSPSPISKYSKGNASLMSVGGGMFWTNAGTLRSFSWSHSWVRGRQSPMEEHSSPTRS